MNATVKNVLIISVKQAVNAVLTTTGLMASMQPWFHLNSWTGVWHILAAVGSVIASREAMIWGPKILKWTTTNSMPNGNGADK